MTGAANGSVLRRSPDISALGRGRRISVISRLRRGAETPDAGISLPVRSVDRRDTIVLARTCDAPKCEIDRALLRGI